MLRTASLAIVLAILWSFFLPTPSFACSCAPASAEKQIARSDVIFIGRAIRTERMGLKAMTIFRVSEPLKGGRATTRRIFHSAGDGANCGVSFQPGRRVLVLASSRQGELSTNLCNLPRAPESTFRSLLKKRP